MRRTGTVAAAAMAVALAATGCTTPSHQVEVAGDRPAAPHAYRTDGDCTVPARYTVYHGTVGGHRDGLVAVTEHPGAAVAVWIPGSGFRPCRSVATHPGNAAALAHDVNTAPKPRGGTVACKMWDGVGLLLYFRAAHGWQRVNVTFGFCGAIQVAGRSPRAVPDSLVHDLRATVPGQWRGRLS